MIGKLTDYKRGKAIVDANLTPIDVEIKRLESRITDLLWCDANADVKSLQGRLNAFYDDRAKGVLYEPRF